MSLQLGEKKGANNTGANEWPDFKIMFPLIKKGAISTRAKRRSK